MQDFLRFTLKAPLASFGAVAVGERRYSNDHPTKSQIIGLLAAGLGIDRFDEARHLALDDGLALAVAMIGRTVPTTDFHTTQTPKARTGKQKGKAWTSRRQELGHAHVSTMLSWRDYLQDVHAECVLWLSRAVGAEPIDLGKLADALNRPAFTLYLGRKSCPLGSPPNARIIRADTLPEAFSGRMVGDEPTAFHADSDAENLTGSGWSVQRRQHRRDRIHQRHGWMFGLRDELVITRDRLPADLEQGR